MGDFGARSRLELIFSCVLAWDFGARSAFLELGPQASEICTGWLRLVTIPPNLVNCEIGIYCYFGCSGILVYDHVGFELVSQDQTGGTGDWFQPISPPE